MLLSQSQHVVGNDVTCMDHRLISTSHLFSFIVVIVLTDRCRLLQLLHIPVVQSDCQLS